MNVGYKVAPTERSLLKGMMAGAIAGVVAMAVKSVAEHYYPPRKDDAPGPHLLLAQRVMGRELEGRKKTVATETIHWGIGAATGAAYGVLAEFYPAATARSGASFGLAMMTLTHESVFPAMGVAASPEKQTKREHRSEAFSHVVYGVVAERVRSIVRPMLG